ncbi:hypothetical protein [Synechocystis salina]|uniref:hypothetical protein n=1 Tax=Synechocystis salina TaxID=945780 RepID=UPI00187FA38C|nr:hypothetical protein [Synechocystis salina]
MDDFASFNIDPITGEVTLTEDPNFQTKPNYKFTVTASDGVNPATEQEIKLEILDDNIAVIENGFFFAQFPDGTRKPLLFQNQPFSVIDSENWQILDTETINGVNQALWYNNVAEEVGVWTTDSNWNWVSSETWQLESLQTFKAEIEFGTDINGNELIGNQYTVLQSGGSVNLLQGIFDFYHIQSGDELISPIKFLGMPFENQNQFGNWDALAAETIDGVNQVLWQNAGTGELSIWQTDSNWNWLSSNVFTPDPAQTIAIENLFGVSL